MKRLPQNNQETEHVQTQTNETQKKPVLRDGTVWCLA